MSLVKRVLNPAKKNSIDGNVFHLFFLGTNAVLYDHLMDEPIIYGNKNLVRSAITDPKKLEAFLEKGISEVIIFLYRMDGIGVFKQQGDQLKGKPSQLIIPNW